MKTRKEAPSSFGARELRCEGQNHPLGIENGRPEFSWLFYQSGRDTLQKAYRLVVSKATNPGSVDMWDTGKVDSPQTHMIRYDGKPLRSRERYQWKVCVWDRHNKQSEFSEETWFEMGILDPEEWTADWIGGFKLLRKEFNLKRSVERARAYIGCAGYYELRINGAKVGDQVLTPSHTDIDKRVEYQVYDITDHLSKGANAVGIMLGRGMIGEVSSSIGVSPWKLDFPKVLLQIAVVYADGSTAQIETDESWLGSSDGPIVSDGVYDGETYDATKEQDGWDRAGFAGNWERVLKAKKPSGNLVPQILPPIRVVKNMVPVFIRKLPDGSYIVDLGQNIAGWALLKVEGPKGQEVVLKFGEMMNSDGSVNQRNLKGAAATDRYILKGTGRETYEPRFTYHGFRYIQVENYPGELMPDFITGRVVSSDVEEISSFDCSEPLFCHIHNAMKWTLRSNLFSIPTDCPQRAERRGWLGDGQLTAEAYIDNYDMQFFYRKWLDDIRDVQDEQTGQILYNMAPKSHRRPYLSVPWSVAYLIVPWYLFLYYNDVTVLEDHYPFMVKSFQYLTSNEEEGLLPGVHAHGDWMAKEFTHQPQIDNGFYLIAARILAAAAEVLGFSDDHRTYTGKAESITVNYNRKFYSPNRYLVPPAGFYDSTPFITQFVQSFPLWLGIVPEQGKEECIQALLWQLQQAHGSTQLNTGILGTKYTVEALSKIGRNDIVCELFARTDYPSWGFMIKNGATTMWERWQYMLGRESRSHNNAALAAPDTWFFSELAGIQKHHNHEGRRIFVVKPYFCDSIQYVDGAMKTPWGRIATSWSRVKEGIVLDLSIPANTFCELNLELPHRKKFSLKGDHQDFDNGVGPEGIDSYCTEFGSGHYRYSLRFRSNKFAG